MTEQFTFKMDSKEQQMQGDKLRDAIKPNYYKATIKGVEIDVIDIIQAFGLSFCLGNSLKYILRAGQKECFEKDLRKAGECISRELDRHRASIAKEDALHNS